MGRPFKHYLQGPRIYSCSNCRSHAADHDEIISKSFQVHIFFVFFLAFFFLAAAYHYLLMHGLSRSPILLSFSCELSLSRFLRLFRFCPLLRLSSHALEHVSYVSVTCLHSAKNAKVFANRLTYSVFAYRDGMGGHISLQTS